MSQVEWDKLERTIQTFSSAEKLELIERVARSLRAPAAEPNYERQREAMQELIAEMEAMPVQIPDDGFSGRDHDAVLYGRKMQ